MRSILDFALDRAWAEDDRLFHSGEPQKNPSMVFATLYQDGLKHAFETLISSQKTEEYSNPDYLKGKLEAYDRAQEEKHRLGRHGDVAYLQGYFMGLAYLGMDEKIRK